MRKKFYMKQFVAASMAAITLATSVPASVHAEGMESVAVTESQDMNTAAEADETTTQESGAGTENEATEAADANAAVASAEAEAAESDTDSNMDSQADSDTESGTEASTEAKISLTNLKVDGIAADSINSNAEEISGTIEIEKMEGIDTYFYEKDGLGQKISLTLGGAFSGADSSVEIDGNKLNFTITPADTPLTGETASIKLAGKYAVTNSDICLPDLAVNQIGIALSQTITIEEGSQGLNYKIDVDVKGGSFKKNLTEDDLTFTGAFKNPSAVSVEMKDSMTGFVVTLTMNAKDMGSQGEGTLKLLPGKLLYPDGKKCTSCLSLRLKDEYRKSEESAGTQINYNNLISDLLSNSTKAWLTSVAMAHPITGALCNIGVGAVSSWVAGKYEKDAKSDVEKIRDEISKSLEATVTHINYAANLVVDDNHYVNALTAQQGVETKAEYLDTVYEKARFIDAATLIACAESNNLDQYQLDTIEQYMESLYSSEEAETGGTLSTKFYEKLLEYGTSLLATTKDGKLQNVDAFQNYLNICEHVYCLNKESFSGRREMNEALMATYEYGYNLLMAAVNYDLAKNNELYQTITKLEATADPADLVGSPAGELANKIQAANRVLTRLTEQEKAIQAAYQKAKATLEKEEANYQSSDRIVKVYGIGENQEGEYISLNASLMTNIQNLKTVNSKLYDIIFKLMAESGLTNCTNYATGEKNLDHCATFFKYDRFELFKQFLVDDSGVTNSWKANAYFSAKDSENSGNPFYGSLTEKDVEEIARRLKDRGYTEGVTAYLEQELYLNGQKAADAVGPNLSTNCMGIYLEGWQETSSSWDINYDTVTMNRYVKYAGEDGNTKQEKAISLIFSVAHEGGFMGWGGSPKVSCLKYTASGTKQQDATYKGNSFLVVKKIDKSLVE